MDYNLPYPNLENRHRKWSYRGRRGDVCAFGYFGYNQPRTGIIVFEEEDFMLVAVNLYKEEGRLWVCDSLPDDIVLYDANEDETLWGVKYFLNAESGGANAEGVLKFLKTEHSIEEKSKWDSFLCQNIMSLVPDILSSEECEILKSQLKKEIAKERGPQYDRYLLEDYCYLMAVLMINERKPSESLYLGDIDNYVYKSERSSRIQILRNQWEHFSYMYGMLLGQVIGTDYNNFLQGFERCCHDRRAHYLHLYHTIARHSIDTIVSLNKTERWRLEQKLRKMATAEEKEDQFTDLDELFGILFPKLLREALSSARPAATIAELRQVTAAQQQKISEMEQKLSDSIASFNTQYQALLHDFEALAEASVTFDELEEALKKLSRTNAENVLSHLSSTLRDENFQRQVPRLMEAVKDNDGPKIAHADQVVLKNEGNIIHE